MDRMGRQDSNETTVDLRDKVRDQSYIKQYNIQTVLAMLKHYQPISRTDIARMTGMSPTSITRIVTALMNQGLIYEASGEQRGGRGRKATNLRVVKDGLYSIGIHLERSVIRLCVLNLADEVLYRGEALVDGECTPEKMAQEAKKLFDRMPAGLIADRSRIGGVGVSLSGTVDMWKGIVNDSYYLKWKKVDLKGIFSEVFNLPITIENDVKACLIGEKVRMSIPDWCDTVYLLVDSGIGMAATSSGGLVRGANNEAGEIAQMPVGRKPDGTVDTLVKHLRDSCLVDQARRHDPSVHTLEALCRAREQGKPWAEEIAADFREHLERMVRMLECIYNPEYMIIGGVVTRRMYPDIAEKMNMPHLCLGTDYEETCMTGAGMIAIRSAIIGHIGQNIE